MQANSHQHYIQTNLNKHEMQPHSKQYAIKIKQNMKCKHTQTNIKFNQHKIKMKYNQTQTKIQQHYYEMQPHKT